MGNGMSLDPHLSFRALRARASRCNLLAKALSLVALLVAALWLHGSHAAPPVIQSASPMSGIPGTVVVIEGENFSPAAADNIVALGSGDATMPVIAASETRLEVLVPHNGSRGRIIVQTDSGSHTTSGEFLVGPVVRSLSPRRARAGSVVWIDGNNLGANPANIAVAFNGVPASVQSANGQRLVVKVPIDATSGMVTVTANGMTGQCPWQFEVLSDVPVVDGFMPAVGAPGTQVTIYGKNFQSGQSIVRFGDVEAVAVAGNGDSLQATVPETASTAPITVSTSSGSGTSRVPFEVAEVGNSLIADAPPIRVATATPGQFIDLPFDAEAGQTLGLGVSSVTQTPLVSSKPPYAVVIKPDGTALISKICIPDCSLAANIPSAGLYSLRIYANSTASTLTAIISLTTPTNASFSASSPYRLPMKGAGRITHLAFSAPQGGFGIIGFEQSAREFMAIPARWRVRKPDGQILTLPGGGTASCAFDICGTLQVLPSLVAGETYVLELEQTLDMAQTALIRLTEPTAIASNRGSVPVLANGSYRRGAVSFAVHAGEPFDLGIISPIDADPQSSRYSKVISAMDLFAPDGSLLRNISYCASLEGAFNPSFYYNEGCAISIRSAPMDGVYTAVIGKHKSLYDDPEFNLDPFLFTLSKPMHRAGSANGSSYPFGVNRPGQRALFSFPAEAGQTMQLVDEGGNSSQMSRYPLELYSPTGSLVHSVAARPANSTRVDFPTLTESGAYRLEESNVGRKSSEAPAIPYYAIRTITTCEDRAGPISTRVVVSGVTPAEPVLGSTFSVDVDVVPFIPVCGVPAGTVKISIAGTQDSCTFETPADHGCSLPANRWGAQTLSLVYTSSDTQVFRSASATAGSAVTILRKPVEVSVVGIAPEPSEVYQYYTVTADVRPVPPAVDPPTGNVFVSAGGGRMCSFTLPASSCSMAASSVGTLNIVAEYQGSNVYALAASPPVAHVVTPAAPRITGFSPTSARTGVAVTINGANFSGVPADNAVTFNGTPAQLASASTTKLVANVPATATSGRIAVTVAGKTGISTTDFIVIPEPGPSIAGFAPTSGTIGVLVTINGAGFSSTPGSNVVTFNGVPATVTTATVAKLTVLVPLGATSGPIRVSVNGQVATSASPFTVLPSGTGTTTVSISSAVPEPSVVNESYVVTALVAPVSPASPAPTGTVVVGNAENGCLIVLPDTACALPGPPDTAEVTLWASYSGDGTYAASRSPAFVHIVNPASPTELCGFAPNVQPNDPPGFVPLEELSGAVWSPGIARSIVGSGNPVVTIVSPSPGAVITSDVVDVVGTISGPTNTGIKANGYVGHGTNGRFLVPDVPLMPGSNTIAVTATTLPGATAVASVAVSSNPQSPSITLKVAQPVGMVPTWISFEFGNHLGAGVGIASIEFDADGDGAFEQSGAAADAIEWTASYSRPGLYMASVRVTDSEGHVHVATRPVLIRSVAGERGMLCDVYGYLRDRLSAGDATGAGNAFVEMVRGGYVSAFADLGGELPNVAAELGHVVSGFVGPRYAEILVMRDNADGTRSGYHVHMIHDADGVWRIQGM